jgi:hypothetical protein
MLFTFALGMTALAAVFAVIKDHKIVGIGFSVLWLAIVVMYITGVRFGTVPLISVTV